VEGVRTIRADNKLKLKWPSKALYIVLGEKWANLTMLDEIKTQANVQDVQVVDAPPEGPTLISKELPHATIVLDIARTEDIGDSRVIADLSRSIQFMRKQKKYNAGEGVELIVVTSQVAFQQAVEKFKDKLSSTVTAQSLTVQDTEPEDADEYTSATIYFCPQEDCHAMIKGKQVETARKSKKKVTCFYCQNANSADALDTISFYFKRV
jgi:hypothetical protein